MTTPVTPDTRQAIAIRYTGAGPFTLVRLGVGVLLLVAAALKAYGFITEPSFGSAGYVDIAQVLIEWGAGLWLLSGVYAHLARWTALAAFIAFAGVSLYQALSGAADCGCFGPVKVHPWYTFTLDAGIVLLLLLSKPRGTVMTRGRFRLASLVILFILTAAPLGVRMVIAEPAQIQPASGGDQAATITTGDEPIDLTVGAQVYDLGYLKPGGVYPVVIMLRNPTEQPIVITKTKAQCVCTKVTETPTEIVPGDIGKLHFTFAAPDKVMRYGKKLTLFMKDAEAKSLELTIKARLGLPLTVRPEALTLSSSSDGEVIEQRLAVLNDGDEPVRLLYATTNIPGVVAIVSREPIPPGSKVELTVKQRNPSPDESTSGGGGGGTIRIHTTLDNQPVLSVSVKINAGVEE